MRPLVLDPHSLPAVEELTGAVITESARADGRRLFRKGEILTFERLPDLHKLEAPVHAVMMEPGEIHEDEAALRLGAAIAGPGTHLQGPLLSRVNVRADYKGLLRIDREAVMAMNQVPDIAVFTLTDRVAVLPGKTVTGVKITPVATRVEHIERVEAIAGKQPVVQIKPFLPLKVGVLSTEGMNRPAQERFRESVSQKLSWFGAQVLDIVEVPRDAEAVAATIIDFAGKGADVILAGGGNTIDPLDPTLLALPMVDAEIVTYGAPLDPGSMLWLAYRGDLPILNLASCSMYSRSTSADLILPWIMAGERITATDIAELGYGGLLGSETAFRFPPYEAEEA